MSDQAHILQSPFAGLAWARHAGALTFQNFWQIGLNINVCLRSVVQAVTLLGFMVSVV